jgi:iron complex outermembrane receptor protein
MVRKIRPLGDCIKNFRMTRVSRGDLLAVFLLVFALRPRLFGQNESSENSVPPDSTLTLGEIEVVAFQVRSTLRDATGSMSVLTVDGINRSDATTLSSAVNMIPGVTMQSGNYATNRIVIRGMGSRTPYNTNRIKAYLNEIPLTNSDGISSPEEVDLQSLGRIEVIKGPGSALFGSGLGGSISMYTPSYENGRQKIGLQYGSFNTIQSQLSGKLKGKESNFWGSFSHLQSDGYRENSRYQRSSVISTAQWRKAGWSLNATLLLSSSNGEIPSSLDLSTFEAHPASAAPSWKAVNGYKKNQKLLSGITLTSGFTENLTNQFIVFGKINDSYEKRPFNNLDDQSGSAGVRNKLTFRTARSEWILGGEWITDQYKWDLIKENQPINKNRENRMLFSVFGMLYYRPSQNVHITVANAINYTRYRLTDLFPANGDQSGTRNFPLVVSPRLGINYELNKDVSLYASAGHGYSLPSPEETLLPAGDINTGIEPEQGYQFEIGTRMNLLDKSCWIDGAVYWIELNNLLVTKRVSEDIFTGMNAGRTRHQGVELMLNNLVADKQSFPGKLLSQLSYAVSLNRFIDFTDNGNNRNGKHLPGIPNQSVQYQLTWTPVKEFELLLHFLYSGDQYLDDGNAVRFGGYFLGNLKMAFTHPFSNQRSLQVFAGVNNLTNSHYASMVVVNAIGIGNNAPRYFYPGMPISGYAGVKMFF